jgi:hypothetical protein
VKIFYKKVRKPRTIGKNFWFHGFLIRVHPWLKKKLRGSPRPRRLCVEGVSVWLRLCAFALKLARLAADKPKGIDWSWPGRIMPAKSELSGKGQGIRTLAFPVRDIK